MSVATSRPEYATLLAKALPAVIHSEKENEHYTALLEELDHKIGKLTSAEQRLAELLTFPRLVTEGTAYVAARWSGV